MDPLLIPVIAIIGGLGVGAFTEWLKFKSKQEKLGASAHELEETVGTLRGALDDSEAERRRLTERVENLETIVTSQAWDALPEGGGAAALERAGREDGDGAEQARRLAQRMQV